MSQVFHVRSWRKKLNLSRKAAAELLGISAHTIKSYELCRRELSRPIQQLMMKLEEELLQNAPSTAMEALAIVGGAFVQAHTIDRAFADRKTMFSPSLMLPCYGQTAKQVQNLCQAYDLNAQMILSKTACASSSLESVNDLVASLKNLCQQPQIKMVFLPATTPFGLGQIAQTEEQEPLEQAGVVFTPALSHCISPTFQPHPTASISEHSFNDHPTLSLARFMKEHRPDVLVVGFTKEHPQYVAPGMADYVVCTSEVNNETMHYLVNDQGTVCHHDTDKEVVLARLFELSLERLDSTQEAQED